MCALSLTNNLFWKSESKLVKRVEDSLDSGNTPYNLQLEVSRQPWPEKGLAFHCLTLIGLCGAHSLGLHIPIHNWVPVKCAEEGVGCREHLGTKGCLTAV